MHSMYIFGHAYRSLVLYALLMNLCVRTFSTVSVQLPQ